MRLCLRDETQLYMGIFEMETHHWLKRLSENIRWAVDIGAASGEYTLYFLLKTQATKVFAFEPDTNCASLLNDNLILNDVRNSPRLQVSNRWVSDSDDNPQIRLDSLANEIKDPVLIKLDVDGGEEKVLRGATVLNTLPDVRWLIETHSKQLELDCIAILSRAGFKTSIIKNAPWRVVVPELRPIEHNRWLVAYKTTMLDQVQGT